jgi:hypothetical protein
VTSIIPKEFKLSDIPRGLRPRCSALTRRGEHCQGQALGDGLCWRHTALDIPAVSITVSPEGKERQRENGRAVLTRLWATRWKDGRPLSDEGRARIVAAQKRRSPESRYPSEETRLKISQGRQRYEASRKASHA